MLASVIHALIELIFHHAVCYLLSIAFNSNNVLNQIGRVPKPAVPTNHLHIGFNRGYGKLKMVEDSGSKGLGVVTIATTIGSRHLVLMR
jgi:hypothetical protein